MTGGTGAFAGYFNQVVELGDAAVEATDEFDSTPFTTFMTDATPRMGSLDPPCCAFLVFLAFFVWFPPDDSGSAAMAEP